MFEMMHYSDLKLWENEIPHLLPDADTPNTLECYVIKSEVPRPAVIIYPGGGYNIRAPHEAAPIAHFYNSRGYHAFVCHYRTSPNRYPAELMDAQRAIKLVRAHAEEWKVDPDRLFTLGFSAGGHLAAHYSNAYNWPEVREMFPESKPVNASLLCYPVITADPKHAQLGSFRNLLGKEELTREEELRFSCDKMVTAQTPPTFLWHTRQDQAVPVMNTLLYGQALAENGVPFAVHIYPEGVHGLATVDSVTNNNVPPAVAHAKDWLDAASKWLSFTF